MNTRRLGLAAVAVILVGGIFLDDPTLMRLLSTVLITTMLALGLQLIAGYAGQVSLGHATFYGVGAYAAGLAATRLGLSFWITAPIAAIVAGIAGLIMSVTVRLRDIYFAMATLAFAVVVQVLVVNLVDLTRGPMGLGGISSPSIGPFAFDSPQRFLYLAFVFVVVQWLIFQRLVKSRFGRTLEAIRENEQAVQALGVNPTVYKMKAIVIGTASAGVAGALQAHFIGFISPEMLSPFDSILLIVMVVVGGLGRLSGAVLGSAVLVILPDYLQIAPTFRMLIYGLGIILFMIFLPEGLAGLVARIGQRLKRSATPSELKDASEETRRGVELA